jgi:POT family proton-dependent oligopeptide transporter
MKLNAHPPALWWLSLVYGLYAISYGVLFANLLLYSNQTSYINFSENHAFQFFAAFGTLTFILPFFGGYICDKHGFLKVAKSGLGLSVIGFLCLALSGTKAFFFIGVALCLTGNAFAMPAIWSMVGIIYTKKDGMQEAGTTIFYLLFNIGFLIAFACSGSIAEALGYSSMFGIFGLGALLALLVLYFKGNTINNLPSTQSNALLFIALTSIIFILTGLLLTFLVINNILMWLLTISVFVYLAVLSRQSKYHNYRNSIRAFMFLCLLGIVGITIYNSEFGLLPEFANHAINLYIGSIKLPAQIITSLDPLFCIILGVLLSYLWVILEKHKKNPGLATKLSLGIILPALGYLLLVFAIWLSMSIKLQLIWLLPVFILFIAGELLVLPIGIAMAVRLAPPDKEGLFMGIWNLMQGFSALITGYIASFTVVKPSQTQLQINMQYTQVFFYSGIVILSVGIIALIVRDKINRLLKVPQK